MAPSARPVARAMAEGALAIRSADVAVAVTGVAGPGGGSEAKPVGSCIWPPPEGAGRRCTGNAASATSAATWCASSPSRSALALLLAGCSIRGEGTMS